MHVILNGVVRETDAATLADLLGPLPGGRAVAVGGEVVPRGEHADLALAEGDVVDVVEAVAGG